MARPSPAARSGNAEGAARTTDGGRPLRAYGCPYDALAFSASGFTAAAGGGVGLAAS